MTSFHCDKNFAHCVSFTVQSTVPYRFTVYVSVCGPYLEQKKERRHAENLKFLKTNLFKKPKQCSVVVSYLFHIISVNTLKWASGGVIYEKVSLSSEQRPRLFHPFYKVSLIKRPRQNSDFCKISYFFYIPYIHNTMK